MDNAVGERFRESVAISMTTTSVTRLDFGQVLKPSGNN